MEYSRTHTLEGGFIEVYHQLPAHYRQPTRRRHAAIVRTDGNAGALTVWRVRHPGEAGGLMNVTVSKAAALLHRLTRVLELSWQ